MRKKKRLLALLLICTFILCTIYCAPTEPVYANENEFIIDRNGTLTKYNGIGGNITIPNRVSTIGEKAFAGNINITSVTIPNSVTYIENNAFDSCTGITQVKLSTNLQSIGDCAFWGCSSLKKIVLPSKVHTIGFGAFCMCDNLKSIYIPKNVKNIGSYAFGHLCVGNNYQKVIDYVIMGEKNSIANKYAEKYQIPFITKKSLKSSIIKVKKKTTSKILVEWKKNINASGYEIQISSNKKFKKSKTKKIIIKTNFTSNYISKITKEKKCYVRIRGYRTISGKNYYSSWSKAKTLSI